LVPFGRVPLALDSVFRLSAVLLGVIFRIAARLALPGQVKELHARLAKLRLNCRRGPHLSPKLRLALVAAEDRRFFLHSGVDPVAVARAVTGVIRGVARGGASTIEQQLVRTVTRRYEKTFSRKLREMLLATTVRDVACKDEVIWVYLQIAYFGWRMNGVREACARTGFRLSELTEYQAALLVARLKYPNPKQMSAVRRAQISLRAKFIVHVISSRKGIDGEAVRTVRSVAAPSLNVSAQ
jgi:penicillin-binding protein 1A